MNQERFKWIVRFIDFDRLNEWETKSIEICERQMKAKGDLSPRMEEILEEIHREKS